MIAEKKIDHETFKYIEVEWSDRVSYSFKLPYGLRKEGEVNRLLHISEVLPHESGLKCNCVCPNCGERLQAKLPKTKDDFTARFAHHNSDTCNFAAETAIHMKAKEILEKEKRMTVPRVVAQDHDFFMEVYKEQEVTFDRVVLEHRVGNVIPDILAYLGERLLMIEITVTHGIDEDKRKKIQNLGISTIEIDLSDNDTNYDPEFLRKQIIHSTQHKYWVYNQPLEKNKDRFKEEFFQNAKNRQEAWEKKRRKDLEDREKLRKVIEEKSKKKVERVEKLLDINHIKGMEEKWEKEFVTNLIWIKASRYMNVSVTSIPEYLNIEVQGNVVFGCDHRIWQSYIFSHYIYNKAKQSGEVTLYLSVEDIQKDVKKVFRNRLINDLVYTRNVNISRNAPGLTRVIYDYLKALERYGYLLEEKAKRISYTKFVILDPTIVYELRFVPKTMPEYNTIEKMIREQEWNKCKELISDLMRKYNGDEEKDHSVYFKALHEIYGRVIARSKGSFILLG